MIRGLLVRGLDGVHLMAQMFGFMLGPVKSFLVCRSVTCEVSLFSSLYSSDT